MGRPWPATNCSRSGGSGALQVHAGIWFINDTLRSIGPLEPDAQTYFDVELHNGQQINLQWRCAVRIRSRSGFRVNFPYLS